MPHPPLDRFVDRFWVRTKAGDYEAAIVHYRIAAALTASFPERNYLLMKAAKLGATSAGG